MRKIISVFIAVSVIFSSMLTVHAAEENYFETASEHLRGTQLNVYNWGEYISDGMDDSMDVNAEFEKLTGIKVNYSNYDTNEDMYTKLKSGGTSYDIIIPSDYMIARLIAEDMLEEINFDNIPNYVNILDEYKNLYFDPENKYSVPYNVGMVGVIYDKTVVAPEDTGSWDLLWNDKYKDNILQFNNPRDAFATAQFLLGIDVNTHNSDDWDRAYSKLVEQKPLVQAYVADEVFSKMESGEAAVGTYYAGDYLLMADVNENLEFYYPEEGTNIFVDSICIPKGVQNKEAAELYINFLLSEDVALANAEYLCYATPNRTVLENEEYSLRDNEYLYPSEENKPKTQYYHNLNREMLDMLSDSWNRLKLEGESDTFMYKGMAGVVIIAILSFVFVTVRKKKRSKLYDV